VLLTPEQLPERLFALKLTDLPGINTRMEARLNRSGIGTVQAFYNLAPKQARAIWGSVEGERFWYRLHGYDLPELPTHKRMVGHSRMLDTELRDIDKAAAVAQRLTVKAAARLRRYELYAGVFVLKVRAVSGVGWVDVLHLPHAQDNDALLSALRQLWARMQAEMGRVRLKKVSICLVDLCRKDEITGDLFATPAASRPSQKARSEALSTAIDSLNRRYGTNAVQIGYCPPTRAGYVGTKIAFNRIPEQAEFWE
jgi:DNA polymerase-4